MSSRMPRLVYSPHYNIRACGIERLHPFDSRKYGRAMRRIRAAIGSRARQITVAPPRPAAEQELLNVHTADYLRKLQDSGYLAQALEIPLVARLPAAFVRRTVLRPMRWAVSGTLLAGELALEHGFAVNMSGGYHHAKPAAGEGFCVYNDIALLIHALRASGKIAQGATVAYVDLDVHQGNGVCHCFLHDRRVAIFDMFNPRIYPAYDRVARDRIDCAIPVDSGCGTGTYLDLLKANLPPFLDRLAEAGEVPLLIFAAGTDVLAGDPLGNLAISAEGIIDRDAFVIEQSRLHKIPCVMLLSGGYTHASHAVIADSLVALASQGRH